MIDNNNNLNNQGSDSGNQNQANDTDYTTSEVSYAPVDDNKVKPKKKSKLKKVVSAVTALALVAAISVGSISGYKWVEANKPFETVKNMLSIADAGVQAEKGSSSDKGSNSSDNKADKDTSSSSSDKSKNWIELSSRKDALTIPEIVDKVMPSVVGISSTLSNGTSTGTGIIMSKDGYIVTNCHVVEDATQIMVVMTGDDGQISTSETTTATDNQNGNSSDSDSESSDSSEGKSYKAKLVGSDSTTDIAVLKIEPDEDLTPAEFGDSDDLKVGELAVAIGNPLGFELFGSVTTGIISALNREIAVDDRTMKLIQTDAAINSGNSGGPLVNSYGQVVGINSVKISSNYYSSVEGLGFAIPITDVKVIINDLINVGYVTGRPSLGILGSEIDSTTAMFNNLPQGIYVIGVNKGGAAEKAGIQEEDIIIGINGEAITTYAELNEIKNKFKVGDTVTITVSRNNREMDFDVTLEESKS